MQDVMNYANLAVDFFKAGFAQVNLILAAVIVLYWGWRISDWGSLVTTAIGAVLMYLVALILAPMVDHNAPFHLPPFQDPAYWRLVASLFLGNTVAIGALNFVKSMITSGTSDEGGGMLAAGAGSHGLADHGHDDHGHGGSHDHDDHGHGGGGHGHDDHGHGGGHDHDDHGHGGGHGHNDHGHNAGGHGGSHH